MQSPYDLIRITAYDIAMFEKNAEKSKIGILLKLIFDELPSELKPFLRFVNPYLKPIDGFEDVHVVGYEICIDENEEIQKFVQNFIPFLILRK